ncbi:hypothetical protein G9A89_013005 [Geosiphon pyriformis]|nr:hypothetical protein G9A89_013005 [Geosiphon pyriformis]
MAMEEANRTKLVNLAIEETSLAAEEKIDQLTKKVENYFTNQQQQQPQRYQPPQRWNQNNFIAESYNETNKTRVINITLCHNNLITNHHYHQLTIHQDHNIKLTTINLLYSQCNNSIDNPFNITKTNPNNQLVPQNPAQPRPTHYHTQSTRIAENANLSNIFPFEFEANESPFLLSNAAANEQKAITAMYTKAEVEEKAIHLILNNGSTRSIITYQLIQQLKRNTPVGEIDNFPFTLDGITISVKVLIMDMPHQCKIRLKNPRITTLLSRTICLKKAPVFKFEKEEKMPVVETFMALELTSNWAEETKQTYFATNSYPEEPETPEWNIPYSKLKPKK